ncbi:alpha/beta fold hydrolase [Pleionea litopenaei]|uniref:Alpha/beta hydrolase n=1 Tax=Pleionea litopenaei TaxID=3070815 RepID=A0AA51RUK0_9GAMM|nr:alpha/beta hydrolase [Pleionea sp. HL-JVS1]WMS87769.1 alpha/beta hydrolase [Pleionea sp. HL-JVS1]
MKSEPFQTHKVSLCGVNCYIEERRPKKQGLSKSSSELSDQADIPNDSRATRTPILFLHGWLDNSESFHFLYEHFSNHWIYSLDFPGHGRSDHLPEGMAYHFLDLVYVIQDAIKHFNWDKVIIVGHSMGGAAATLFSSLSDQVEKLILIEALGPLTVSPNQTLELMQRSIKQRSSQQNKQRRIFDSIEQAVIARAEHSELAPELVRPMVERGIEAVEQGVRWSSDPRLRISSINRLTETQLEPLMSQILQPVLLIEAKQGLFSQNALIQARKSHFKQLEIVELDGGHHVHLEHPQRVASAMIQFLSTE